MPRKSAKPKRFRVAFSFAGEKREFVAEVAAILAKRFGEEAILYDKFHKAEFAQHRLGIDLPALYHEESDLNVVILCPRYKKKAWTGLEWTAIHALLMGKDKNRVMLSRFEHASVKGLYGNAGFVELDDETPQGLVNLILQRLATNEGHSRDHYLTGAGAPSGSVDTMAVFRHQAVNQYLAAVHKRFLIHNSVGLPAVEDQKQRSAKADKIEELFVPPVCSHFHLSPEAFEQAVTKGERLTEDLLPKLAAARRVVLLADPGMGKSTLIQWLVVALSAAEHAVPKDARVLGRAIPLPFILRDLVRGLPDDPGRWSWKVLVEAFFSRRHAESLDSAMGAELAKDEAAQRAVLSSPHAWFLLDGLDEISDPKRRHALRDAIWEGFKAHPEARFLVTSRLVGYEEAEVDRRPEASDYAMIQDQRGTWHGMPNEETKSFPADAPRRSGAKFKLYKLLATRLYLAPWDDPRQKAFSHHWFTLRFGESEGPSWGARFVNAVRRHAATATLGRVPNLLLLMALLYRYKADLPDGRAKVYDGISRAYLEGIDIARQLRDGRVGEAVPYRLDQKERLLAIVAMQMQARRSSPFPREKLGEILVKQADLEAWLAPEFGLASDARASGELRRFLHHVADRSGLLLPRGEGIYGFAHLSFQEYYAACYLEQEFRRLLNAQANQGRAAAGGLFRRSEAQESKPPVPVKQEDFAQWAADPAWREVLLFLVERLSASADDTRTVLEWMFPWQEARPKAKNPQPVLPLTAAELLATLSLDKEVNLAESERLQLWTQLWQSWLDWPHPLYSEHAWHLPPSLLEATSFQDQMLRCLMDCA